MSSRVVKHSAAKRDLKAHFVYIGADSEEAAFRFLSAAEESFQDLPRNPLMGAACQLRGQRAKSFRRWRVKDFAQFRHGNVREFEKFIERPPSRSAGGTSGLSQPDRYYIPSFTVGVP
jgi:plasmid stabilization system protein ParE